MSDKSIVYFNYEIHPRRWERLNTRLASLGSEFEFKRELTDDESRHVSMVVSKTRELDDAELSRFPALRALLLWTTEDWPATFDRSRFPVTVRTAEISRGTEVAELALAHALVGLKRLRQIPRVGSLRSFARTLFPRTAGEAVGAHNWMRMKTGTLYRKTVGIVGYGLIGHEIRRRLCGFDCDVVYFHSRRYSGTIESRLRIDWRPLDEVFARSDVVIVQLPLNERTAGCVDSTVFRRARPGLVLVNCGRAGVIERRSLERWLRFDRSAYYGADVFWQEPMPFWDRMRFRRNVFITPHMAESVYAENDVDGRMIHQLQSLLGEIHVESGLR